MKIEDLISPREAAKLLGVSLRRVQQLCRDGHIGFMVDNRYIIDINQLRKFKKAWEQSD